MATNWSAGLNTGIQGAQMGGQVGGMWGAVIGGVAGFALGKGAPMARTMIDKYNNELVKLHAQDLFKLQSEQNFENMRTAKALMDYQDNQRVATSTYNAQYGAAEQLGSSAEALSQVLDFQTSEAKAGVMLNWEIGIDNYNTMVDQMTNQRVSALKRFDDNTPIDFAGLTKTGMDMYNMYRSGNTMGMFGQGGGGGNTGQGGFFGTFTKGGNQTSTVVNKIR